MVNFILSLNNFYYCVQYSFQYNQNQGLTVILITLCLLWHIFSLFTQTLHAQIIITGLDKNLRSSLLFGIRLNCGLSGSLPCGQVSKKSCCPGKEI